MHNHPIIKEILLLLQYFVAERAVLMGGERMLFVIMQSEVYAIPAIEIAHISVEVDALKRKGEVISIRKLLRQRAHRPPIDLFDPGLPPGLVRLSDCLEHLLQLSGDVPLNQLFEMVLQQGGIEEYLDLIPDAKLLQEKILKCRMMIEKASRDDVGDGFVGLLAAVIAFAKSDTIDAVAENSFICLPVEQSAPSLTSEKLVARLAEGDLPALQAESERVLGSGIATSVSNSVSEISIPVTRELDIDTFPDRPVLEPLDRFFVSKRLEKFVMNVSALNNFLHCPLQFYFQNLLRAPSPRSEALGFGSAIHYAIEQLFTKMKLRADEQFPQKEEMVADFRHHLHQTREVFSQEAYERRSQYGEKVLKNYYDRYVNSWNKIVLVETNIQHVQLAGVPLKGKIDKLEFKRGGVHIVDYKTGDIDRAKKYMKPPGDDDPNGGNYWRQAVFYTLLVEHRQGKKWTPEGFTFDFLEPDAENHFQQVKMDIRAEDKESVKQQVVSVWDRISKQDFYSGCGRTTCEWCSLVRDNQMLRDLAKH